MVYPGSMPTYIYSPHSLCLGSLLPFLTQLCRFVSRGRSRRLLLRVIFARLKTSLLTVPQDVLHQLPILPCKAAKFYTTLEQTVDSRQVGWQRDAKLEGHTDWIAPSTNTTYDASTVTMPLLEFVHHSVAHELVHNGATFQVLLCSC